MQNVSGLATSEPVSSGFVDSPSEHQRRSSFNLLMLSISSNEAVHHPVLSEAIALAYSALAHLLWHISKTQCLLSTE